MQGKERLRAGSLSFVEVLAASVALIALSMTPVLVAPYMYGAAGNASWLAYAFGGVMLLLVALNLNHFAKRATGSGSIFLYAAKELGPTIGTLAGWSLIWAYVFVGASQFGSEPLFFGLVGQALGVSVPALAVMAGLAIVCWLLAVRDVALSTIVMLVLEAISVSIILVLVGVVLFKHGPHIDTAQLHLEGAGKASIGLAIATAVFSFVGFESATAFGDEAKNPLRTIPRAVAWSVVIAGAFFILTVYTEILGLHGSKPSFDQLSAPLSTLADTVGVGYLKLPIVIGAIFSAFSCCLACVNSAARIMLPMAQRGLLPRRIAAIHPRFHTPHVAIVVTAIAMLAIGLTMYVLHVAPVDSFNYCGTLSSLSFIAVYLAIAIAAPLYLKRIGEGRPIHTLVSIVACLFLLGTAVTLFYPAPPAPTNLFPYLFVAYLVVGYVLHRFARTNAEDAAATEVS